jgi:hypothetical protein
LADLAAAMNNASQAQTKMKMSQEDLLANTEKLEPDAEGLQERPRPALQERGGHQNRQTIKSCSRMWN